MFVMLRNLLLFTLLAGLTACSDPGPQKVKLEGRTMGTTYHITYIDPTGQQDEQQLQQKIDAVLLQVNQVASTYMPDSELSRFNSMQSTTPVQASAMMQLLVREALQLGDLTQGYLDPTVGPLVNLWGFGPTHRPEKAPSDAEIAAMLPQIGYHQIQLNGDQLSKTRPELYIDMSSFAKGYGVDAVAELLDQNQIHNYLVEIGGELKTKGQSLAQKDWVIAVEKPMTDEQVVQRLFQPKDNAVATSGDYRIFFEENGQRFSHLIDPKTGRPVTHRVASVTVVHPSCMRADGLATGFLVMGVDKALEIANAEQLAVMLIEKNPDGSFTEHYSEAFKPYLHQMSQN